MYLGLSMSLTAFRGASGFDPVTLFAGGEEGVLIDSSNSATRFQERTGASATTPASAYGDPVGTVLDLSGNDNHLTAPSDAARPLFARVPAVGRRNLYAVSNDFTDGVLWTINASNEAVTPSYGTSPVGNSTLFADDGLGGTGGVWIRQTSNSVVAGQAYTFSVYAKAAGNSEIRIRIDGAYVSTANQVLFDLSDGTVAAEGASTSSSVEDAGGGWYRLIVTVASAQSTGGNGGIWIYMTDDAGGTTVTKDGTNSVEISGAQLENSASVTNYQTVVAAYDITEAGVDDVDYLLFDGVNDDLSTASIDFGTDCTTGVVDISAATITANQTFATGYTIDSDNVASLLIDRDLTAAEDSDLTAWLQAKAGLA